MNENTEARLLLERAMDDEPAIALDAESVLHRARRGLRQRRAATMGAVATGVVGVTLAAVAVTSPSPPSVGLGAPPVSTPSVPQSCLRTIGLKDVCVAPVPPPRTDAVTERLTAALANAKVIPAGFQVLKAPLARSEPLVFIRDISDGPIASARLQDNRGWGTLGLLVSDGLAPGYDLIHCSAVEGVLGCTERTMTDGSKARVVVQSGPVGVPGSTMIRLTVLRANGSFLDARVSNAGDLGAPGSNTPPTRDEPPLGVQDMFKIGEVTGLTL